MLSIHFKDKSSEFAQATGSHWHTFTMAGTHTMQVCVPGSGKALAENLAELLYQPAELPLNIRAAIYLPNLPWFTVLTGNLVVIYRGIVSCTEDTIFVNSGPETDCYRFGPASGFINAFSLSRQLKTGDNLSKLHKHIAARRTL